MITYISSPCRQLIRTPQDLYYTFRCFRVTLENVGQFRVLVPPYLALVGAGLPTEKQFWTDLGEFINALLKTHNYFTLGDILRKCLCRFLCEMLAGRSDEFKLKFCLFVCFGYVLMCFFKEKEYLHAQCLFCSLDHLVTANVDYKSAPVLTVNMYQVLTANLY